MKVLGIVGSPRKEGNTHILVGETLFGAQVAGADVEEIFLNDLDIKPCQACNACHRTGKCIQNDDMEDLLVKMIESQVWILGTPIYWWGPTGQFKTFLDRWYHPKHQNFKNKRVIVIIVLGGGNKSYAKHTIGMFEDVLDYLNMDMFELIVAPGVNARGDIQNYPSLLKKARITGKDAVEL